MAVDIVALDHRSLPRSRNARITLLGEAKCTNKPRTLADLQRLEHIRDLLVAGNWNAADAALAIFSRSGFAPDLTAQAKPGGPRLLTLQTMYRIT